MISRQTDNLPPKPIQALLYAPEQTRRQLWQLRSWQLLRVRRIGIARRCFNERGGEVEQLIHDADDVHLARPRIDHRQDDSVDTEIVFAVVERALQNGLQTGYERVVANEPTTYQDDLVGLRDHFCRFSGHIRSGYADQLSNMREQTTEVSHSCSEECSNAVLMMSFANGIHVMMDSSLEGTLTLSGAGHFGQYRTPLG